MRKLLFVLALPFVLGVPAFVFAKGSPANPLPTIGALHDVVDTLREDAAQLRQNTEADIREKRQELEDSTKAARETFEVQVRERMASGTPLTPDELQALKSGWEAFQQNVALARQTFLDEVKEKRQELGQTIATKREELKQKVAQFKDERKKGIVERIGDSLNEVNGRVVMSFTNSLNQIDEVLSRIVSRADKAEVNGADVSAVRTVVTAAGSAIKTARDAITAQSAKVYAPVSVAEDTARADLAAVRQTLATDLKSVRTLVQAARDAVHNAAVTLGKIPNVDSYEITTSTTPEEEK